MVTRSSLWYIVLVCVLAVLPTWVLCSVGDQSPKFQRCVASCVTDTCRNHRPLPFTDDTIVPSDPLPWYLVLTGWTCESNCEYHCTHRITNEAHKRVQDLRESVSRRLRQEQDSLREEHERWRKQIAWQEAGQGLDPACEGEAFSDMDGQCISLMQSPPKPLQSENALRQEYEQRIQQELDWLPLIDKQTVQFFGKWAQLRVLGMQEPFSVLFSLLNLGVHIYALFYILPELVPNGYPLKSTYTRHAKISIVAWASSALFHTRDLWWTERLDYFMAAAVLLSGLFFTVCRLTYANPITNFYKRWSIVCIVAWILHVLYLLSHRRLNYSYNITACLTVGLLHNFLWLSAACAPRLVFGLARRFSANLAPIRAYSKATDNDHDIDHTKSSRTYTDLSGKQRKQLICLVLAMTLAPALEIFDFPPMLRLVDAHALWHASTVPISLYWYIWLANDAQACVLERGWKLDHHDIQLKETNHGHTLSHHTGLPPPGVSPAKTTTFSFPSVPATSSASTDEIIGQLRNGLHVYANMGMNALRRLRALLITQSQ